MLEPRSQEIPLRFGLDLTEDEEGSPNGALELENFDFDREGALVRRNGWSLVSGVSGNHSNPKSDYVGLTAAGNTLGLIRAGNVEPLSASSMSSVSSPPPLLDQQTLGTYWSGLRVQAVDLARSGNYLCLAATCVTETTGAELSVSPVYTIRYRVVDLATGAVVFTGTEPNGSYGVRVFAVSVSSVPRFVMFSLDASRGLWASWIVLSTDPASWTVQTGLSQIVTPTDAVANTVPLEAASDGTYVYVATVESGNMTLRKIDGTGTVAATKATGNAVGGPVAVALGVNSGSVVVTLRQTTANDVFCETFPTSLASQTNTKTITTGLGAKCRTLALTEYVNGSVKIFADVTSGFVRVFDYSHATAGSVVTVCTVDNTNLASKPWRVDVPGFSADRVYVSVVAANAASTGFRTVMIGAVLSVTDFTDPADGFSIVGQAGFDEAGPATTTYLNSGQLSSTTGLYLATLADVETGDANSLAVDPYVRRVRVTQLSTSTVRPAVCASLGGVSYVAGSALQTFDGARSGNAAFFAAPETPTLTQPNAGALTGTYSYCVVFELSDERGNIQVSPPSLPASITVTSKKVTVVAHVTPQLTGRSTQSTLTNLRVKIYRTAAGASVYYLAHTYVVAAGTVVTVDDNVTDTVLAGAETLYTTGGELESEPAPPMRFVVSHRNRLFGVRSDSLDIGYTKETTPPFLAQWNEVLTTRCDNDGGPPTALASISDKLLVFQADQICAFYGQGPDATGSGAFAVPEVVARGVGVDDANRGSVTPTPVGVVFRSRTGIKAIGPDFSVVDFGRAVNPLLGSDTCHRARFMPSRHQIWFLMRDSSGTTRQYILIYDTRFNRWVKWTTTIATFEDVRELNGTVYAISRSDLYYLNTATGMDYGSVLFSQTIGLPWFRGPDRAQELRLWKVHVSGRKTAGAQNDATVALQIFSQDERKDKASDVADTTLTWAGSSVTQLANNFLLSGRAVSPRCRAFRCRIVVTPQTADATSSWLALSAVVYDFGILAGRGKVPSSRRPTIS